MDLDYYYSLLAEAVAGKDEATRNKIYNDAWTLIRKSSHLTREAAASHAAALENAIRRIEDELAADDVKSEADIKAVLSTGRNWRPAVILASTLVALVALSALLYGFANKRPIGAGMTAASSKASRSGEDAVMEDLKAGVDGGSSGEGLPFAFQRQVVF